jgi:hypothetical protein
VSSLSLKNQEPIYKRYVYPNGETLELTKSEFDRVVDLFRILNEQDRKLERQQQSGSNIAASPGDV